MIAKAGAGGKVSLSIKACAYGCYGLVSSLNNSADRPDGLECFCLL